MQLFYSRLGRRLAFIYVCAVILTLPMPYYQCVVTRGEFACFLWQLPLAAVALPWSLFFRYVVDSGSDEMRLLIYVAFTSPNILLLSGLGAGIEKFLNRRRHDA